MADAGFDPAQLSESQQHALGTFTAMTNQEPADALPLLRRSEWNIQIAIAKFFDGDAPDPLAETAAASPPTHSSHRETLLDDYTPFPSRTSTRLGRVPAPRVVPPPDSHKTYTPSLLVQLLLTPFNILTKVVGGSFTVLGYMLSFIPRIFPSVFARTSSPRLRSGRRALNPRDNASRFIREFQEDYGSNQLPFYEGGYAAAYDAAKRDMKFLLVVLLSPEHDDTDSWVRETLLSTEVGDLLQRNKDELLLWAGNVQDSEVYQVSTALMCNKFPFAALIVHTPQDSSTAMSTVARLTGPTTPTAFTTRLQRVIDQHKTALTRARASRREQQAARDLREEQNTAYERSLAQDRERARQRREAEATQRQAEEDARNRAAEEQRKTQLQEQWRQWRASKIAPEPDATVKDATRVSLRIVSGDRIVRKFAKDAPLEELYAFVDCHGVDATGSAPSAPEGYVHTYGFRLVSPMPRAIYDVATGGTVGESIGRSGNLIVEPLDDDEVS